MHLDSPERDEGRVVLDGVPNQLRTGRLSLGADDGRLLVLLRLLHLCTHAPTTASPPPPTNLGSHTPCQPQRHQGLRLAQFQIGRGHMAACLQREAVSLTTKRARSASCAATCLDSMAAVYSRPKVSWERTHHSKTSGAVRVAGVASTAPKGSH